MIVSTVFALINISNTKIMKGVYIEGIDVSNLTIEEATKKMNDNLYKILNADLNLKYKDEIGNKPRETGLSPERIAEGEASINSIDLKQTSKDTNIPIQE